MLPVFIERGCTDAVQLTACERGLQQVRGIHGTFGFSGTHQRVHLVDEEDDAAFGSGHFREHGLQPLLELAAIFCASDQRAHVERHQLLVLQAFGHVALDDAQRQAFGNRRLAHAGLADQNRIVLGAARQHLNGAADFLVAADDGIELSGLRGFSEVAGIFLQGVIALFGGSTVRRAALADGVDRLVETLRGDACVLQGLRGFRLFDSQGLQQALGRNETVARLLGKLLRGIEDARHFGGEIDLTGTAA
jgi:hypothetical protein